MSDSTTNTSTIITVPPVPPVTPSATQGTQAKPTEKPRDAADQPLGEPGLKALREEREAREALEKELRPLKEQMDALRDIFGDKAKESGQDIVTTLQREVATIQRESLVDRVARRHGITDDADVEFLRGATDEAAMNRLAERLKAVTPAPRTLAPDPAQNASTSAAAAEDAEYAAFFPSTRK